MRINITIDKVYTDIQISWQTAHRSRSHEDWLYRWANVCSTLEGYWMAVNYNHELTFRTPELESLLDEITELRRIANINTYAWNALPEVLDVAW